MFFLFELNALVGTDHEIKKKKTQKNTMFLSIVTKNQKCLIDNNMKWYIA